MEGFRQGPVVLRQHCLGERPGIVRVPEKHIRPGQPAVTPLAQQEVVGRLPDQAALSGLLNTLYDTQYPVLSVECLEIG